MLHNNNTNNNNNNNNNNDNNFIVKIKKKKKKKKIAYVQSLRSVVSEKYDKYYLPIVWENPSINYNYSFLDVSW